MDLSCYISNFFDIEDKAVVLFCCKGDKPTGDILQKIDLLTDGAVSQMFASGEFDGSSNKAIMLHNVPEVASGRVILAGLGEEKEADFDAVRRASGIVGKMILAHKLKSVALYYDGSDTNPVVSAIVEGVLLGSFQFLNYKTDKDKNKNEIDTVSIAVPNGSKLKQAEAGMIRGEIIASAVTHCRELVDTPGNDLYPQSYADHAKQLAKELKFKCTILGPAEIKKEKMMALEAVAIGSDNKPRFVVLEYNGKAKGKPVVLVGKGVTFDSGGISLKAGLGMEEMKGDMTGSAVVLNVICAAARLKAKINLVVLMPLVENMPSGHATRPGDIIGSRAGYTIEVINTDAEGRLILADALDYADKFDPQAVIDIATLTGAAMYVLGYAGAPFVGTSQKLNDNIRAASERTAERVWEMPLWKDFSDLMKSSIADIKNSGGRQAGTLTASAFLKKFTKDWPWAHIDIAYCDVEKAGLPYVPKGASAFGVRLLIDLVMHWKKV